MPFSISAGVGFIALFGIAVLNGIVLIEHFKELKHKGFESMEDLIKQGTKDRLRAVLLTASAAALGFLPMAISTNAGAEVQRPLATVVIGGLITATILTLVVLPVLYAYFNKPKEDNDKTPKKSLVGLSIIALLFSVNIKAQEQPLTLQELIPMAIENNVGLKANELKMEQSNTLINSAFSFDKTHVYYEFDENNLAVNNEPLRVFGIQQDFRFPTVYFSEKKANKARYDFISSSYGIQKKALEREVTSNYYKYQIALEKEQIYKKLDSLYSNFSDMASRRFELGETNYLEKITATSKQKQINLQYHQAKQNVIVAYNDLLKVIQSENKIDIASEPATKLDVNVIEVNSNPEMEYYQNKISLLDAERSFEKQQLLPDITFNYFQGTNSQLNNSLYGYQLGLKIPLLFSGQSSKIKSARIAQESAILESREYEIQLNAKLEILNMQLLQFQKALSYYEQEGTVLSDEILKTANGSFKNGEIDFYQYIQSLESAYEIKIDYLNKINDYNQTVIAINYLTL
jgi:cobalt-zinc-cadmium resistance protein CzcA